LISILRGVKFSPENLSKVNPLNIKLKLRGVKFSPEKPLQGKPSYFKVGCSEHPYLAAQAEVYIYIPHPLVGDARKN